MHGLGMHEQVDGVSHSQVQDAIRHGPDNIAFLSPGGRQEIILCHDMEIDIAVLRRLSQA